MTKKKVTMTIDEEVHEEFQKVCESLAMKVSPKVELMMKDFLKKVRGDADE